MRIIILYHVIYNASYNLFAALLAEIEKRGTKMLHCSCST